MGEGGVAREMAQLLDQKTQVGFLEPTWGYSMSEVLMASSGFCEHYMHGNRHTCR